MKWTEEQSRAISLRNKNILVAAAAGSGKTAVLVERIKRLLLEERCPIDSMLIVTFTNAAAAEMKEKISTALNKSVASIVETAEAEQRQLTEAEREDVAFLKKQLGLLPVAQISTFHAFALEIIKKYFYIIDIEPNFKICDEAQGALIKGDAMDQLLEEFFEESSPQFIRFLKCYSGDRNEDKLRDMIDNAFNVIQSLPEPWEWLDRKVKELTAAKDENLPLFEFLWKILREIIFEQKEVLKLNLEGALNLQLDGAAKLAESDISKLAELEKVLETGNYNNYDEVKAAIGSFKLDTLSKKYFATSDDKAEEAERFKKTFEKNRNGVKKQIQEAGKKFFPVSKDALFDEMRETGEDALMLQKLMVRYGEIFSQMKRDDGLVDFNDIEHYAYEILKDQQVSQYYRDKFNHIFIDEYQDSNVMQEAFIDRIKRPDNLFMVGDVKQSIYKFRLAEPEIFQRRYEDYAKCSDGLSEKIDLNKNFRSKRPVIDFVNDVFDGIMEGYDENAALYMGDPYGDEAYHKPVLYLTSAPWEEDESIDDEIKNLMKAEKEALAAVKIIKDSVGKPYFDSKAGIERKLSLGDIVILMRGIKSYGDVFYNVLMENDITAYVDDNEGYFDTMEINIMLSLLSIIDNEKQDVQLLTVLRSEIFGFTIEEMAEIRIAEKEGSYHDALMAYGRGDKEDYEYSIPLQKKVGNAVNTLRNWQKEAAFMPLEDQVWKLMLETGFYIAMGAMPGGRQRQANLQALIDKARAYRKNQGGSLYGFIRYIDAVKKRKVASGQVKIAGEGQDMVRIMTIHKSKGLEFPMVIQAGYCRRLQYSSAGKSLLIHKDLGLAFPVVNPEKGWYKTTVLQNIIKEKFQREEVSEEKRILYVSYTRAKDRLVLLGICNDIQKELDKVGSEGSSKGTYFDMTGNRICVRNRQVEIIEDRELADLAKGRRRKSSAAAALFEQSVDTGDKQLAQQIDRQMRFVYPDEKELQLKSKYSVSELNASGRQPIESLAEPASFKTKDVFSAPQRGTIFHCLLEHLDFARGRKEGISYINDLIKWLVDEKFLTEQEAETIQPEYAEILLQSELGGRLAASEAVHKERAFNLVHEIEGSQVIVQGVIDCYFEEDDGLVLVDYKTSWINPNLNIEWEKNRIRNQYQTQIELYRKALEASTGKKVKEAWIYLTNCGQMVDF